MTKVVNVHEAKTHFSKLLARAEAGEEIVIAKAGKPLARLVPYRERPTKRVPGTAKSLIVVGEDFDDPLPESIQRLFER
ncbi:type II toxin-antitoxin system Phd/YefM family antitoxin [Kyrpidia sp.]|uniref:type II toxin-antitoxin system Phd/YefM family antitoxin n=1 Tax=Kyrpidia sp. TaxID=2073077 RepID=UPI00258307F5|nr:type II toxin-antitoxin system Phd/YefM family antitoxin [Kyrpidia sp.]MCL6576123.1 type II toxin-antitoxin system Phd/YefM family antitoxin [Kyrpidia sp.]